MRQHGRFEYSAIVDRADFVWPDARRLAFYLAVNLEDFEFGGGAGATLANSNPAPDILNYAWREYGNRVGVWRMLELFDELRLPLTVLPNTSLYETSPRLLEAFRERGDEILAHGITNSHRQGEDDEDAERDLIARTTRAIEANEGTHPRGWLGPWISESEATPDLLHEAGYEFVLDWAHDEQPVWMKTRGGRILSVPYPQEINDVPQIIGRQHTSAQFCEMIEAAFDVQFEEAKHRSSVFCIAVHPYLMGQPNRFHHFRTTLRRIVAQFDERVWVTTARRINDHFRAIEDRG